MLLALAVRRGDAPRVEELVEELPALATVEAVAQPPRCWPPSGRDEARRPPILSSAFRRDPYDEELVQLLLRVAPRAGLRALDALEDEGFEPYGDAVLRIRLLSAAGEVAAARRALQTMIEEDGIDGPALDGSAFADIARVDPRLMESALSIDLRIQGACGSWYARKDLALRQLARLEGRFSEALPPLHAATRSSPKDEYAWTRLGNVLLESGDVTGAREAWSRAVRCSDDLADLPDGPWMEQVPEVMLERARELAAQDDYAWSWDTLGDVAWACGREDEAEAAWRHACRLDPHGEIWTAKLSRRALGLDPGIGRDDPESLAPLLTAVWGPR